MNNKEIIAAVKSNLPRTFSFEVCSCATFEEAYELSGKLQDAIHSAISGNFGKSTSTKDLSLWKDYTKNKGYRGLMTGVVKRDNFVIIVENKKVKRSALEIKSFEEALKTKDKLSKSGM